MMAMRTKHEVQAYSIAKQLVEALARLEAFIEDPTMILESAEGLARKESKGVQGAVTALKEHYCGE